MEMIRLNSGHSIPQLGIGVYMMNDAAQCRQNVRNALEIGYRHIDTAQVYHNEAAVGDAVAESGIPRNEIFITSKVWTSNYGYEKCRASIARSLERLRTDYIDLMLLHRPFGDVQGAWRALEEAADAGMIRSVGLSNFVTDAEWASLGTMRISPAVNQVELHPYEQRKALKQRMAEKQIAVEAWYPLGHGDKNLLNEAVISEAARAHGKSNVQVVLRWHIQMGHIVFPKAANPVHLKENFEIFDFSLTDGEMAKIAALDRGQELFHSMKWLDQIMYRFMKA